MMLLLEAFRRAWLALFGHRPVYVVRGGKSGVWTDGMNRDEAIDSVCGMFEPRYLRWQLYARMDWLSSMKFIPPRNWAQTDNFLGRVKRFLMLEEMR
jgi:hypothetical protein